MECANDVMTLNKKKRTRNDQQEFSEWLDSTRLSELDEDTCKKMVAQLSLYNYKYDDVRELTKDALFISANREPVAEYNLRRLKEVSSKVNPVAVIRPVTSRGRSKGVDSHFERNTPGVALLCKDALVSLVGYNLHPRWGLHNGALGYVKEIVFREGESPNNGNLPSYVVVNFPSYNGPAWVSESPKVRHRVMLYMMYCVMEYII